MMSPTCQTSKNLYFFLYGKKYVPKKDKRTVVLNPTEVEARNNGNEGILDFDFEMDPVD